MDSHFFDTLRQSRLSDILLPLLVPILILIITTTARAMVTTVTKMSSSPGKEHLEGGEALARVSQVPPTAADLDRVAAVRLLSAKNESISFGSLYPQEASHRVLLIFIRHFFCGYCQEYLKTLSASITPAMLAAQPTPTSVVVIGHGSPDLIDFYVETTQCPFPIYAEPTKKLYEELGMARTLGMGSARPEYQQKSQSSVILSSFTQAARSGRNALKGGDLSQVGGEFLLQGKEVVFCHRMQNTRDHAEIPEIRKALHLASEPTPDRRSQRSSNASSHEHAQESS